MRGRWSGVFIEASILEKVRVLQCWSTRINYNYLAFRAALMNYRSLQLSRALAINEQLDAAALEYNDQSQLVSNWVLYSITVQRSPWRVHPELMRQLLRIWAVVDLRWCSKQNSGHSMSALSTCAPIGAARERESQRLCAATFVYRGIIVSV